MNLEKAVKRKVVEYNELTITREMLLDLVRGQRRPKAGPAGSRLEFGIRRE